MLQINSSFFYNNSAYYGGAIAIIDREFRMAHTTISKCHAWSGGGCLSVEQGADAVLYNCTIEGCQGEIEVSRTMMQQQVMCTHLPA